MQPRKFFIGRVVVLVLIAVVASGVYLYMHVLAPMYRTEVVQAPGYKNATYTIEHTHITLTNGIAQTPVVPGSATSMTTRYFGNEVVGDFNNDGFQDVAFLLTQDSGGSGTFYYVAVALGTPSGGYQGINAVFLGDRIAPQTTEFKDGEIVISFAYHAKGEPMTATPSLGISERFKVEGTTLVKLNAIVP